MAASAAFVSVILYGSHRLLFCHLHHRLFTFAAAQIVLAQLEGPGSRGPDQQASSYDTLTAQLEERIEDADAWVQRLMQKDAGLGERDAVGFCVCTISNKEQLLGRVCIAHKYAS
jgi:hypothetical protein